MVGSRNVILHTLSEGIPVYFFMPKFYGHKLEVGDNLHQPSFVQFLDYIHALYIGKLQVLDQVGRQGLVRHAASRTYVSSAT